MVYRIMVLLRNISSPSTVLSKFQDLAALPAMAPKRVSNGANQASKRAKTGPKAGDELADMVEKEREVIASLPWWGDVMEDMDSIFAEYGGVSEFLCKRYPTADDRKEFSEQLIQNFYPPDETPLDKDFGVGIKNFHLFQICWHVQAGNKGLVIAEFMKNLVSLVLLQGCKTDATLVAGAEFPVLQPLCLEFFEAKWETSKLQPQLLECFESQSIGFTKGWTRGCAFVFAAFLLIKHDLVEFYRSKLPKQYFNFCLLKGMVSGDFTTEADRIQANRGAWVEFNMYFSMTLHLL